MHQKRELNEEELEQIIQNAYSPHGNWMNFSRLACQQQSQIIVWPLVMHKINWESIQKLALSRCRVDNQNISILAKLHCHHFQVLQLRYNEIKKEGIIKLLAQCWPHLKELLFDGNFLGNQGFKQILQSKSLPMLSKLWIGQNQIDSEGIERAIEFPAFTQLCSLSLSLNNIGSKGIRYLSKVQMKNLQTLHIQNCNLGNEGTKHLAKLKYPQLKQLYFGSNNFGTSGYACLINFAYDNKMYLNFWDIDAIDLQWISAYNFCYQTSIYYQVISSQLWDYCYQCMKNRINQ